MIHFETSADGRQVSLQASLNAFEILLFAIVPVSTV